MPIPPGGCSSGGGGGGCLFDIFANRPSAAAVDSCTIFVATDTGDKYISDGALWYQFGVGGTQFSYTTPQFSAGVNYAALVTDRVILLNAPSLTVTLPAGATADTLLIIKDYAGVATASPHTLTPSGGDTIEHVASFPIDVNNMAVTLGFNPSDSNWMVL